MRRNQKPGLRMSTIGFVQSKNHTRRPRFIVTEIDNLFKRIVLPSFNCLKEDIASAFHDERRLDRWKYIWRTRGQASDYRVINNRNELGRKRDNLSGENYRGDQQLGHRIPRNDLHAASQPTRNGVHLENSKPRQSKDKLSHAPWSCSVSGAVAARRREMHKTFPWHENPYLDSDRNATP